MIHKNLCLFCLFLGIFSEGSSFAVSKKNCRSSLKGVVSNQTLVSEEKTLVEINRIREEHGLCPLKMWLQLSDCAREHSQNMAVEKCPFGHHGFKQRGEKMQKIAILRSFAENVAYSFNYKDPVRVAVDGWMKSPSHKKNILGDYEETGIGIAINEKQEFYITQLFAKRYNSSVDSRKIVLDR